MIAPHGLRTGRAESVWNKGSEEERIALVKRVCSNFRLKDLTLCYDLKNPFKKLKEIRENSDSSKWCPLTDDFRTALLGNV